MEDLPAATFLNFLSGLASQGLMSLGEIPNPAAGGERSINLPHARYTIELLEILFAKSEGNRNSEETSYLEAMTEDLRNRYRELSGGGEA